MDETAEADSLHRRLRLILEQSGMPTAVTRLADETILFVNRAMLRAGGWDAPEIVGRTTDEINLWADSEAHGAFMEHLRQEGIAYEMPGCLRRSDGSRLDVVTSAEVVIELDDEPCMLALFYDASDSRRADEEMRLYRLLLESGASETREILNRGRIDDLVQAGGSEWVLEFVETCLEEIAANVDKLISAMRKGDAESVRKFAHTLAGTTATIGATRFPWLCHELEKEGRDAVVSAHVSPEDVERAWFALNDVWREEFARRS